MSGGHPLSADRSETETVVSMMTAYEALSLMIAFAMMLIALLAYIDRNNKRK